MANEPWDTHGATLPLTPATTALSRTVNASISAATSVTLNAATQLIEVNALAQGIYMRYSAGVTSGNADEYIQAGTTRHYWIPSGVTVVSFIEQAASATLVLIEK